MARYHLTPDGPKVCSARLKCDYEAAAEKRGEKVEIEHFPNKAAADAAYAKQLAEKHEDTAESGVTKESALRKDTSEKKSEPVQEKTDEKSNVTGEWAQLRERLMVADPVNFDEEMAELYYERAGYSGAITGLMRAIDRDQKYADKYAAKYDENHPDVLTYLRVVKEQQEKINEIRPKLEAVNKKVQFYQNIFDERGGWTRAFLVANTNGHVHKNMRCSTCYDDTQFQWMTMYSGKNEEEIVNDAGERACTVCYPSAESSGAIKRATKMFTKEEIDQQKAREEREAKKAQKEKEAQEKGIFDENGNVLSIRYPGDDSWSKSTYKTERTAAIDLVDNIGYIARMDMWDREGYAYNPDARLRYQYFVDELSKAIARKHGTTQEAVLAEANKKWEKKKKSWGVE